MYLGTRSHSASARDAANVGLDASTNARAWNHGEHRYDPHGHRRSRDLPHRGAPALNSCRQRIGQLGEFKRSSTINTCCRQRPS